MLSRLMQESFSHLSVMRTWVMFAEVISFVDDTWLPVDIELVLFDPVLDPMEPHFHCL